MSFCDIAVDACPRTDLHRILEQARGMAEEFGANQKLTISESIKVAAALDEN